MKKFFLLSAILLPFMSLAQAELEQKGETLPIHDNTTKIDLTLFDKGGTKYLGVKVNTLLDLGCVDTADAMLIYLDNGEEVACRVEEMNCGQTVNNKGAFGKKVTRHAEFDLLYLLDAGDLELLREHPINAIDIEGEHLTIERSLDMFQSMSADHFKNCFAKNLRL